ncbi:MAG: histidinol-phosphatase HisJ family protein [Flammeovirgaceae bacterium]
MWTNYHQHSHYCDGKHSPEEHIQAAIAQNVKILGFSSHSPVRFPSVWNMPLEKLDDYLFEIRQLKQKYESQIEIYTSLELDYIPHVIDLHTNYIQNACLDYTLCSIHYVDSFEDGKHWEIDGTHQIFLQGLEQIFQNNIKKAVKRYFQLTREMIQNSCPQVLGHLDKIKMQNKEGKLFSETETWYKDEIMQTLEFIKNKNVIVEVNTRGLYKKVSTETYPSVWILKQIKAMNIPIMLNSDAHHPSEITKCFSETASLLKNIGFKEWMIFSKEKWISVPFNKNGCML